MKKFAFGIMVVAVALLMCGFATAVYLPPETPETSGLVTSTAIACAGVVSEHESIVLETTSGNLHDDPPLESGEVYSVAAYNQDLLGRGNFEYQKDVGVSTANAVVGQSNIEADTQLLFDGGRAGLDESVYFFGASTGRSRSGENSLCPFVEAETMTDPPYNTYAYMSSAIDVSAADYASAFDVRSIAATVDTPVSVSGDVAGMGAGSIRVTVDVLDQTARGNGLDKGIYTPSSEFRYDERTSALGVWDFVKQFSYVSGINL